MDLATIGAKALKAEGKLENLDVSEEINACSVKVKAEVDGKETDFLVMFKNETHNHPTEIEPFGGAATCLGGAIRDPLSGRAYVYQGMRISGAGDIFESLDETIEGKLPQRVLSKTAAAGFSSYGNQIGAATGISNEIYHNKYKAKRMEAGFVVAAAPLDFVRRETPQEGDIVILLGGETGRDGCGGATGSSKSQNKESASECSAEVQKGDPLLERRIQRLFRNKKATTLIKKCNDFGAGGVSVAIGELAEGLDIYLDKVPKKYGGLNVTETAISESQERMAVVIDASDKDKFFALVEEENLTATVVAKVTNLKRLRMFNKGETVVDIERSFLDTNGVRQSASVKCRTFKKDGVFENCSNEIKGFLQKGDYISAIKETLGDKNVAIQKGQSEMFDSTIGAGTVFMPFGGKHQLTPALVMAAKLPVSGETDMASVASWAFNPYVTDDNPYIGSMYAVIASVAKLVAAGVSYTEDGTDIRLTFQEYFKRLNGCPERFGEPFAALLGALYAQYHLGTAAIGGKDSMSGSFEKIDAPNTLISFALGTANTKELITSVFKADDRIIRLPISDNLIPKFDYVKQLFKTVAEQIKLGNITAATVVEGGGAVAAAVKSAIGNQLSVKFVNLTPEHFETRLGDILVAVKDESAFKNLNYEHFADIEHEGENAIFAHGKAFGIKEAAKLLSGQEKIYPTVAPASGNAQNAPVVNKNIVIKSKGIATPKVLIPVFPGANGEFDMAKRFEAEGARVETLVVKNLTQKDIKDSIARLSAAIGKSEIVALVGGNEPDGGGKFLTSLFLNPAIKQEMEKLLSRDGLVLGISNGFHALVRLGLLPHGKVAAQSSIMLTHNAIGRHVSTIARVRIAQNSSPWLSGFKVGEVFAVPVSHADGRFVASEEELQKLIKNGQIATQYVDFAGNATMQAPFNPSGSMYAVEGLVSNCGKIFGKMGHAERYQSGLYKNIPDNFDMNLFKNGVKYFK
jgi:phosphoribosylformylglycinamidine synthase